MVNPFTNGMYNDSVLYVIFLYDSSVVSQSIFLATASAKPVSVISKTNFSGFKYCFQQHSFMSLKINGNHIMQSIDAT